MLESNSEDMTQTLNASVVICAYTEERWDDLLAAVESVKRQTVRAQEIIVVIDHNPALLDRVRTALVGVITAENSQPRGLSGARNSGIAAASGAVVAFLDDDAIAAPDWLQQVLAGYDGPQVIGVGGAITPHWDEGRPAWFPEEFDWVVGCTYRGMPSAPAPVRNLIGANMSLRRDVFATVGGFRSDIGRIGSLPLGCEETELCIRARQHWPEAIITYVPAAQVFHRVPTRRGRWSYFQSRCYAEGLSKAMVSRLVGTSDGLASERSYTLRTLPLGIVRGLDAALWGDPDGFKRAMAIVGGLGITTAGYVTGRFSLTKHTLLRFFQRSAARAPEASYEVSR